MVKRCKAGPGGFANKVAFAPKYNKYPRPGRKNQQPRKPTQ